MTDHLEGELAGAGGIRLFWQAWLPASPPRAIVAVAHGAGEHSGRYAHVAERLTAEGYAVYALDHRGHGRSGGTRALIDRVDNATADLDSLIVQATREHPSTGVFLLGHSMGGTLALRYSCEHQERLSGLILSGALAAMEPAPAVQRAIVRALSALAPSAGVIQVDPALVSRDPQVVQAYEADPLVHHRKLPARTVAELSAAIDALPVDVEAIEVPALILYGSFDRLCPTRGSVMLAERIGSRDTTVKAYVGLHHEILNEPERDSVLDEICAWLGERSGSAAAA